MFSRDDFSEGVSVLAVTLGILLFIVVCSAGGYAVATVWNTHVTQPLNRQNLDNNANRRIQVEQEYRNLDNDFVAAQQRIPNDKAAIARYKADNGDPKTYSWTQQQAFNELENTLAGDYSAEVRLANDYNALATNADTRAFRPADLPSQLTPDQQQQ